MTPDQKLILLEALRYSLHKLDEKISIIEDSQERNRTDMLYTRKERQQCWEAIQVAESIR